MALLPAGAAAIAMPSPENRFILIPRPWQGLVPPARLQLKQTCVEAGRDAAILCAMWELENSRWKLGLLENKPRSSGRALAMGRGAGRGAELVPGTPKHPHGSSPGALPCQRRGWEGCWSCPAALDPLVQRSLRSLGLSPSFSRRLG